MIVLHTSGSASTFRERFEPKHRASRRLGFTMIELLVVLAVMALLLSLVVPAVMSARGSARRLDCENRLRQFGVALHGFESSHKHLPVGTIFRDVRSYGTEWVSAQVQLLPYLEQAAAFEELTTKPRYGRLGPEMTLQLAVFHCPDEPVATGVSYRTCSGRHAAFYDFGNEKHQGTLASGFGALPGTSSMKPLRMADVRDGLSQTAAMSERTISPDPDRGFNPKTDVWFSGAGDLGFDLDLRTTDDAVNVCRALVDTPQSSFSKFAGRNVVEAGFGFTAYNHALPPNSAVVDCAMDSLSTSLDHAWLDRPTKAVVGARSNHFDRSVSLLLMDGSVRLVSPNVDLEAWRALASRQDADVALE